MSSPASFGQHPTRGAHANPPSTSNDTNEDGVTIRPMRLKVLYTFDNQNTTNCLARWPHVLDIQTITMEEGGVIGVIELKICLEAIIECSPELVAILDQDFTVYAYDYSEYESPLVGQGRLSKVLRATSPIPDGPAQQSRQLITGRVCKNILGIFNKGVKDTLEVKLRLVPVPIAVQSEYEQDMAKYREKSNSIPVSGVEVNEWNNLVQSNKNTPFAARRESAPIAQSPHQRDGVSMELINQLLTPATVPQQQQQEPQLPTPTNLTHAPDIVTPTANNSGKAKKTNSRPSSRASVKRPRKPKLPAATGGNTSGYEECTDGDDGPAPQKRAKITRANSNAKTSFGSAHDSLRAAASAASSLRVFRPIAISPAPGPGPGAGAGSHLQEIARAPTPIPNLQNHKMGRFQPPARSSLLRASNVSRQEISEPGNSPYAQSPIPDDELRFSIESTTFSPERNESPNNTMPEIGSSPPVMHTRPPSMLRSSPPIPSSPVLPQMPRNDSGFMSGSLEELFGDDDGAGCLLNDDEDEPMRQMEDDDVEFIASVDRPPPPPVNAGPKEFTITQVTPGPMELLPTRMHVIPPPKAPRPPRQARSRGGSVLSEDGQSTLPTARGGRAPSRLPTSYTPPEDPADMSQNPPHPLQVVSHPQQPEYQQIPRQAPEQMYSPGHDLSQPEHQPTQRQPLEHASTPLPNVSQSDPRSHMLVRTASMGSLTLPQIPASDPVLPPSSLQRSQTWSELPPHPMSEAHMPTQSYANQRPAIPSAGPPIAYSRTFNAKKAAIKNKLEMAIQKGEMPPYCHNCGAIDTPTWRKAWYQVHQGAPIYYEYSDAPGEVTAVTILTRDANNTPTSYELIKKYLLPEENRNDYLEFNLCNPCGIWMTKYKSQRPPEKWENPPLHMKPVEKKRVYQRPSRTRKPPASTLPVANPTSEAYFPPSDANYPQSEAALPPTEAGGRQVDGVSPTDTTGIHLQDPIQQTERRRSTSTNPPKRLNAMTSDAASAALRIALQSSPARWQGTQESPITLEEDLGVTRRVLFPSPRKDGSPQVLGEVTSNVVEVATTLTSLKGNLLEVADKENCPPVISADENTEILALFEEIPRPTTPVQTTTIDAFKTPTRPTPSHKHNTRSAAKSAKSARSGKSPGYLLQTTPTGTRYINNDVFESPFTATLNQLMSEANNRESPSRRGRDLDVDFGNLPDLPLDSQQSNTNPEFDLDDFFSTDAPMRSSPPRHFQLYEDPLAMSQITWDDFHAFDPDQLAAHQAKDVVVKTEPVESPQKPRGLDKAGEETSR